MDEAEIRAFQTDVTLAIKTLADILGAVVTANHIDGNLDPTRFRQVMEDLAARPDVSPLERALFERVLASML